jgi:hypothetical protein
MALVQFSRQRRRQRAPVFQASRQERAVGVPLADYLDELEEVARFALARANAIRGCPVHPDVTIRVGNLAAEREADVLASAMLGEEGAAWRPAALKLAIKEALDEASEGECPACAALGERGR